MRLGAAPLISGRQDIRRAHFKQGKRHYSGLAGRLTQPENILFHGDSVVTGGFATTKAQTFTRLFNDGIQNLYRRGGIGFNSVGGYLTEWVLAGGTLATTSGLGLWNYFGTGTGVTRTITIPTDRFRIHFEGAAGTGNAEINIDGGSFTTFSTTSAAGLPMVYDSGTVAPGINGNTHTIIVRSAAAAVTYMTGGEFFNGDYGVGVHCWEVGHSGFTAGDFTATNLIHWKWMTPGYIRPDCVIIQFGLNEQNTAVSAATYKSNLSTLVDNYYTNCDPDPTIVLLGIWARGDTYKRTDAVVTNGSAVVTSAGATFPTGLAVNGGAAYEANVTNDFPAGTYVLSRDSATQVTMSQNATSGGSGRTFVTRYQDAQWQPYREAMRSLAQERGLIFIDLYDLSGYVGTKGTGSINDAVVTSGSPTVTSASAYFRAGIDEGTVVTNGLGFAGIPANTYIGVVNSGTSIGLSSTQYTNTPVNATASSPAGGAPLIFTSRPDPETLTADLLHPSDRGHQWIADELLRVFTGVPRSGPISAGIIDAKGDIIVGSAADTPVKLPVGQDGQVATAAPSATTGIIYQDPGIQQALRSIVPNASGGTFTTTGTAAPTVTSSVAASTVDTAYGPAVRIASATSGTAATVAWATNLTRTSAIPEFGARVSPNAASFTAARYWVGLFASTPFGSDDPAVVGAGFRYATVADGTAFWRTWTNDGTSTGLVTVTTKAIATGGIYFLRIEFVGAKGTNATSIRFYIDDTLVATHASDLPGGSALNLTPWLGVNPSAAAQKNLDIIHASLTV